MAAAGVNDHEVRPPSLPGALVDGMALDVLSAGLGAAVTDAGLLQRVGAEWLRRRFAANMVLRVMRVGPRLPESCEAFRSLCLPPCTPSKCAADVARSSYVMYLIGGGRVGLYMLGS